MSESRCSGIGGPLENPKGHLGKGGPLKGKGKGASKGKGERIDDAAVGHPKGKDNAKQKSTGKGDQGRPCAEGGPKGAWNDSMTAARNKGKGKGKPQGKSNAGQGPLGAAGSSSDVWNEATAAGDNQGKGRDSNKLMGSGKGSAVSTKGGTRNQARIAPAYLQTPAYFRYAEGKQQSWNGAVGACPSKGKAVGKGKRVNARRRFPRASERPTREVQAHSATSDPGSQLHARQAPHPNASLSENRNQFHMIRSGHHHCARSAPKCVRFACLGTECELVLSSWKMALRHMKDYGHHHGGRRKASVAKAASLVMDVPCHQAARTGNSAVSCSMTCCAICQEDLNEPESRLDCMHTFHFDCALRCMPHIRRAGCPICRSPSPIWLHGISAEHGIQNMTSEADADSELDAESDADSESDSHADSESHLDSQSSEANYQHEEQHPRIERDVSSQSDRLSDFFGDDSHREEIDRLHEEFPDLDSDALEDLHEARMHDDCDCGSCYSGGS